MNREEKLRLALNILNSTAIQQNPDPTDVASLRDLWPEAQSTWSADELAAFTVQAIIMQQKEYGSSAADRSTEE
jgi:hypothetical protein